MPATNRGVIDRRRLLAAGGAVAAVLVSAALILLFVYDHAEFGSRAAAGYDAAQFKALMRTGRPPKRADSAAARVKPGCVRLCRSAKAMSQAQAHPLP